MSAASNFNTSFLTSAVSAFVAIMAPISALAHATQTNGAVLGDTIKVPFAFANTASSDFTYAAGYSGNHNVIIAKDVVLSGIKYQKFDLTDADMQKVSSAMISQLGAQAGARLAYDVISSSIASVVTNVNFPTSASITANQLTSSAGLVTLGTQADNANWTARNLILNPEAYAYLLSNSACNSAYAYGSPTAVQDGIFQNVFGFSPYKVTCPLPNGSKGLVLNPNAILIATAPHTPAETSKGLVSAETIVDNKTQLALSLRSWYEPNTATTRFTLDCLSGAALGDPNALFQLK